MSNVSKLREQLSKDLVKLGNALKALADKVGNYLFQFITLLIAARVQYPKQDVTPSDMYLTLNYLHGITTHTVGRDTYFNVIAGEVMKCDPSGTGKPRDEYSRLISNYASRILGACFNKELVSLDGWVTSDGDVVVPTLSDLKKYKNEMKRYSRGEEVAEILEKPSKTVQLGDPLPKSVVDTEKAAFQLRRIEATLNQCRSQTVVKLYTTKLAALGNQLNKAVAKLDKPKRRNAKKAS